MYVNLVKGFAGRQTGATVEGAVFTSFVAIVTITKHTHYEYLGPNIRSLLGTAILSTPR